MRGLDPRIHAVAGSVSMTTGRRRVGAAKSHILQQIGEYPGRRLDLFTILLVYDLI
jgi:hypothetical protein